MTDDWLYWILQRRRAVGLGKYCARVSGGSRGGCKGARSAHTGEGGGEEARTRWRMRRQRRRWNQKDRETMTVAGAGACVSTGLAGVGTSVGLGSMPTCRISPGGGTLLFPDRSAKKMKLLDLNTFAVSNAFSTGSFDLLDGDWMGTQTSMFYPF